MEDALRKLIETGVLLGEWDGDKVGGLSPEWFLARQVDMLDMRGDLRIRGGDHLLFGRHVKIITASHLFVGAEVSGELLVKRCWIEPFAFIGSYALLYNCVIGEHAVVSVGSLVASMVVPPYSMVAGNPAVIVREYKDGRWRRV